MQDVKMTEQLAGRENARCGTERHENARHRQIIQSLVSASLWNTHYKSCCRLRTCSSNSFDTKDYVTMPDTRKSAPDKMFLDLLTVSRTGCHSVAYNEFAPVLCDFWEMQPYQAITQYHFDVEIVEKIQYDTIWCTMLMCAHELTRVRLIYHMELTIKKLKK